VADAVADALAQMTAPGPAAEMPDITAAMVSAVAASLQDFGGKVQRDLDSMGMRLEKLSEILDRAVTVLSSMGSRRRDGQTEALALLRQVADEAADDIRNDNRQRRALASGPLA
jgi:DNA anti-recombination protein RmuC